MRTEKNIHSKTVMLMYFALVFLVYILATVMPSGSYALGSSDLLPLEDYPVGAFFTKNGKACTCHQNEDCVASGKNCNCMRYYPTGNKSTCEIDLFGVQCIGFARLCQYRLFGYIDTGETADKFYNILGGSMKGGEWSASDAEYYIKKSMVGGHIRMGGHSLVIMSIGEDGFRTYECNSSVHGRECMVFIREWTYKSFYREYRNSDWHYINIPKDRKYKKDKENNEDKITTAQGTIENTAVNTTKAVNTTHSPETSIAPRIVTCASTEFSSPVKKPTIITIMRKIVYRIINSRICPLNYRIMETR